MEDPVVLLERDLHGHPFAGFLGKTVRGSSAGAWMGESTELGMSMSSSKTGIILIGIRG